MPTNTVPGEHLRKAMACVEPVAGRSLDKCKFVLVASARGAMSFETTDCEVWSEYHFPGEFEPTSCLVPVDRLDAVAKAHPEATEFVFDSNDSRLKVTVGRSKYTLPVAETRFFKDGPVTARGRNCRVDCGELTRALRRVAPAMGSTKQAVRPPIGYGVFVASDAEGNLKLVAPCIHRFGKELVKADYDKAEAKKFWGVLPRAFVLHLRDMAKALSGMANMWVSDNTYQLSTVNYEFSGSLVAVNRDKLPDMRSITDPSEPEWSSWMTRESLIALIREGGVFAEIQDDAGKSYNRALLKFDHRSVTLRSEDGSSDSEADCKSTGPLEVTVNGEYLRDLARVLDKGEEFTFVSKGKKRFFMAVAGSFVYTIATIC